LVTDGEFTARIEELLKEEKQIEAEIVENWLSVQVIDLRFMV